MTSGDDLFDYDELRRLSRATMVRVTVATTVVVLGGRQTTTVLRDEPSARRPVLRRRGGGGVVLAHPGDLWCDWWFPTDDERWRADVREAAMEVGQWWAGALSSRVTGDVRVHEGPMVGADEHRVACFAGRGPGEVFVGGRKAVGLTQWRVREGTYLSSVLPALGSDELVDLLADPPTDLAVALDHHTLSTLGVNEPDALADDLAGQSGVPTMRFLTIPR